MRRVVASAMVGVRMFDRPDQRTGRPFVGIVRSILPGGQGVLVSVRGVGSLVVAPSDLLPIPMGPERQGVEIRTAPGVWAGWRRVCLSCGATVSQDHVPGGEACQASQDDRAWKLETDI